MTISRSRLVDTTVSRVANVTWVAETRKRLSSLGWFMPRPPQRNAEVEAAPRKQPFSEHSQFLKRESANEKTGDDDFEPLSVGRTVATLFELFECQLTKTEN